MKMRWSRAGPVTVATTPAHDRGEAWGRAGPPRWPGCCGDPSAPSPGTWPARNAITVKHVHTHTLLLGGQAGGSSVVWSMSSPVKQRASFSVCFFSTKDCTNSPVSASLPSFGAWVVQLNKGQAFLFVSSAPRTAPTHLCQHRFRRLEHE